MTQHQHDRKPKTTFLRFCPTEAEVIGLHEAIVLERLRFWLRYSKHRFDDQAWVYNTYEAWQAQFPFWSRRTIQAIFLHLERLGIVESSQAYNRSRWDKTKWYTINSQKLAELVGMESPLASSPTQAEQSLDELRALPYSDYLQTSHWQARRRRHLRSSGYRCQVCNATRETLHVHHRTYERLGEKRHGDLLTLCQACHGIFHREGRLATSDER